MGLRQLHTAETMFIDDGLTDGAVFPPSSNAVYDALQNATELPSVTAEDDGDVLTVVSGAWAKATPSGGGTFVVHSEYDDATGIITLDKTWKEIHDAMASGQIPVIYFITLADVDNTELYTSLLLIIQTEKAGTSAHYVKGWNFEESDYVSFVTYSENGYPHIGEE